MEMTLKAARINADLDQRTAASRIGITPETLGNWENGITFPNVPQIMKIEEVYGVKYADIRFLPKCTV